MPDASGRLAMVYGSAGIGAVVLGPLAAQTTGGGRIAFLLFSIAFSAYLTGWGLAPDLMKAERRHWTVTGLRRQGGPGSGG